MPLFFLNFCVSLSIYAMNYLGFISAYSLMGIIRIRGANETRQLASYSNSTRSKLDSSKLDSSSSSIRNVNESSRETRNSTRKAREKLENILYIKF